MAMWYWYENDGLLTNSLRHPPLSRPIAAAAEWLTPPIVSNLHSHFARWTAARVSPGPVIPHRLWIDQDGRAAFRFADREPASMPVVGAGEALAQWLVLLSKWMEIHVVLARSRTVWPHSPAVGSTTVHHTITPAASTGAISPGQLGTGCSWAGCNCCRRYRIARYATRERSILNW